MSAAPAQRHGSNARQRLADLCGVLSEETPATDAPVRRSIPNLAFLPAFGAAAGGLGAAVILAAYVVFPHPVPIVLGLGVATAVRAVAAERGLAQAVQAAAGGDALSANLAVAFTLALKLAALIALDPVSDGRVLVAAYAASGLAAAVMLRRAAGQGGWAQLAAATLLSLTVVLLALRPVTAAFSVAAASVSAAIASAALTRSGARHRPGAVMSVFEAVFMITAAAVIAGPG